MKSILIILLHAFIGWAICGAIIGISFQFTAETNALIIHALAVPVVFGIISLNYFRKFHYTSPLKTALIFLIFIMLMDFFFVATVIQKSYVMFGSILGTWIPFILIFFTTYLTGILVNKNKS